MENAVWCSSLRGISARRVRLRMPLIHTRRKPSGDCSQCVARSLQSARCAVEFARCRDAARSCDDAVVCVRVAGSSTPNEGCRGRLIGRGRLVIRARGASPRTEQQRQRDRRCVSDRGRTPCTPPPSSSRRARVPRVAQQQHRRALQRHLRRGATLQLGMQLRHQLGRVVVIHLPASTATTALLPASMKAVASGFAPATLLPSSSSMPHADNTTSRHTAQRQRRDVRGVQHTVSQVAPRRQHQLRACRVVRHHHAVPCEMHHRVTRQLLADPPARGSGTPQQDALRIEASRSVALPSPRCAAARDRGSRARSTPDRRSATAPRPPRRSSLRHPLHHRPPTTSRPIPPAAPCGSPCVPATACRCHPSAAPRAAASSRHRHAHPGDRARAAYSSAVRATWRSAWRPGPSSTPPRPRCARAAPIVRRHAAGSGAVRSSDGAAHRAPCAATPAHSRPAPRTAARRRVGPAQASAPAPRPAVDSHRPTAVTVRAKACAVSPRASAMSTSVRREAVATSRSWLASAALTTCRCEARRHHHRGIEQALGTRDVLHAARHAPTRRQHRDELHRHLPEVGPQRHPATAAPPSGPAPPSPATRRDPGRPSHVRGCRPARPTSPCVAPPTPAPVPRWCGPAVPR